MTLTKADLIDCIYNQVELAKTKSAQLVDCLLEILKKTFENGEDIVISDFAKFWVKTKRERRGRNPVTGEDLMLAPRKVIVFISSGVLRDKVNRKR